MERLLKDWLMPILVILTLLLSWGSLSNAATYYAVKGSDGKTYGRLSAWPVTGTSTQYTDLQDFLNTRDGSNHELILSGGVSGVTWEGTELDAAAGINTSGTSAYVHGARSTDLDGASHSGTVTWSMGGTIKDETLTLDQGFWYIENIRIVSASNSTEEAIVAANLASWTSHLKDTEVVQGTGNTASRLVYMYDSATTLYNVDITQFQTGNATYGISFSASARVPSSYLYRVRIRDTGGSAAVNITETGAGSQYDVYLVNCDIASNAGNVDGIVTANNTNAYVINSKIGPNGRGGGGQGYALREAGTGAITVHNSAIYGSTFRPADKITSGTVNGMDTAGNTIYQAPQYTANRRVGILTPVVDDYGRIDEAEWFADLSAASGYYITFACSSTDTVTGSDFGRLTNLINAGHDLGSHSRHHSDLSSTSAFAINYGGAGAGEIRVTVDYSGTSATVVFYANGAVTGASDFPGATTNDNLSNVYTWAQSLAGWSIGWDTDTHEVAGNTYQDSLPAYCLQSGTTVASGVTATVGVNIANHHNEEITLSKSDLESGVTATGWTCKSFHYPYNLQSTASKNAAINAGYLIARGGGYAIGDTTHYELEDFDISSASVLDVATVLGADPSQLEVEYFSATLFQGMVDRGLFWSPYIHTYTDWGSNQTEMGQNWSMLFKVAGQTPGLYITTFANAASEIRGTTSVYGLPSGIDYYTGGAITSGTTRIKRSWVRGTEDWTPQGDSPLVQVGKPDANLNGTVDWEEMLILDPNGTKVPQYGSVDVGSIERPGKIVVAPSGASTFPYNNPNLGVTDFDTADDWAEISNQTIRVKRGDYTNYKVETIPKRMINMPGARYE